MSRKNYFILLSGLVVGYIVFVAQKVLEPRFALGHICADGQLERSAPPLFPGGANLFECYTSMGFWTAWIVMLFLWVGLPLVVLSLAWRKMRSAAR